MRLDLGLRLANIESIVTNRNALYQAGVFSWRRIEKALAVFRSRCVRPFLLRFASVLRLLRLIPDAFRLLRQRRNELSLI